MSPDHVPTPVAVLALIVLTVASLLVVATSAGRAETDSHATTQGPTASTSPLPTGEIISGPGPRGGGLAWLPLALVAVFVLAAAAAWLLLGRA